jgi:hypothetical protein
LRLSLRAAEEVRELRVAVTLRVLRVLLEAQSVAQTLLGEPDDVVVLVLGAGDLPGLLVGMDALLSGRFATTRTPLSR